MAAKVDETYTVERALDKAGIPWGVCVRRDGCVKVSVRALGGVVSMQADLLVGSSLTQVFPQTLMAQNDWDDVSVTVELGNPATAWVELRSTGGRKNEGRRLGFLPVSGKTTAYRLLQDVSKVLVPEGRQYGQQVVRVYAMYKASEDSGQREPRDPVATLGDRRRALALAA